MASELLKRTVYGAGYLLVFLVSLAFPDLHYLAFGAVIVLLVILSGWEFQNMLRRKWVAERMLMFLVCAGALAAVFWFQSVLSLSGLKELALFLCVTILIIPELFKSDFFESLSYISYYSTGILLFSFGLSHLVLIVNMEQGLYRVLFLLAAVWMNDTFAYLASRVLGERRHRIGLKASPNKSYEGYAAGIVGALIGAFLVNRLFSDNFSYGFGALRVASTGTVFSWWQSLLLALFISLFAFIGDLAESVLKRSVNFKDSGLLIPGHGGLMDRLDSLYLSAPLYYYLLLILG